MPAHPIAAAVVVLAAADPATCDRVALTELAAGVQRVRSWLDALEATLSQHALRLGEPAVATAGGRRSSREASTVAARGELCATLPAVHDALAAGAVAAGHADAIARAAAQLDDDTRPDLLAQSEQLVATATGMTVDRFDRHVRDLVRRLEGDGLERAARLRQQRSLRRWVDQHTGMCHTHVALDPEADARLAAVLDAAVAAERSRAETDPSRSFEQLQADAFITLITGEGSSRGPVGILALADLDTLRDGLHPHTVCETFDGQPLPPDTVRRLACDAAIIPVVLDGRGVVLDHGRARRMATAEQRRALRAMYRTCGHPHCSVRFADCEIHHVIEWIRQRGPTDLANLLPLCSRHHHDVHDGRWQLTLHPDRTIILRRPDGTTYFDGTTIDVATTGVHTENDITRHIRQRAAALRVA